MAGAQRRAQHAPDRSFVAARRNRDAHRRQPGQRRLSRRVDEFNRDLTTAVRDHAHRHERRLSRGNIRPFQALTPSVERRRRHAGLPTKFAHRQTRRRLSSDQLSPKRHTIRRRSSRHGRHREEPRIKSTPSSYHAQQQCRFGDGYCVFKLSITSTIFSASRKWTSDKSRSTWAKSTSVRRSVTFTCRQPASGANSMNKFAVPRRSYS